MKRPLTLGFIPANRSFFDPQLASKMRRESIAAMQAAGITVVVPDENTTNLGCVDTIQEAEITAKLFRNAEVDGIIIGAVNFGSEQGAAWTVKKAALNVPILIYGCPEESVLKLNSKRRDAFCGLLSIGEALRQIGAKYSVAPRAILSPSEPAFRDTLDWFSAVCRVVSGLRHARYGQIGARPDGFWTCRFDEKQLQLLGPTTVTLDLSEAIAGVQNIADDDSDIQAIRDDITQYADTSALTSPAFLKIAKLELFLKRWSEANGIGAFALQCWTSIENNLGICACTTLSRLSDTGIPAACEADILGTLSMHACQLASTTPAALADWNNLHNNDDDLVNLWHCGVFPKSFAKETPKLGIHSILPVAGASSEDDSQGVVNLKAKPSPVSLFRVTQSPEGRWQAVIAHGAFEDNEAESPGSYGWCRIDGLLPFYRNVLLQHFPHHVAVTQSHVGNALYEAFGNYLGMNVYHPGQITPGTYQPALPF